MTIDLLTDRAHTVKETAEFLNTTEEGVLSLIKQNDLPASNINTKPNAQRPRWRILASDIGKGQLTPNVQRLNGYIGWLGAQDDSTGGRIGDHRHILHIGPLCGAQIRAWYPRFLRVRDCRKYQKRRACRQLSRYLIAKTNASHDFAPSQAYKAAQTARMVRPASLLRLHGLFAKHGGYWLRRSLRLS